MEAEVKSEATGGRVNVETKDQKVCLPLSQDYLPCPPGVQLPSSTLIIGDLGAYKGERLRSVGSCPPATPQYGLPGRC